MTMFAQQQGTGLRITKLLIQDTGTYNPQWRRPYQTRATQRELNMFAERIDGMKSITAAGLAGLAGQFIEPMAQPEKKLEIPGDWGDRRLRFMMEVQNTDMHGSILTEVVLGYTDHFGVVVHPTAAHLDPNMRFIINSIVKVRSVRQNTPLGLADYTSVRDSSHLLFQDNWSGVLNQQQEVRMRPSDLFSSMQLTHLPEVGQIADTRVMQMNRAEFSRRENGLPAQYVAKVLHNYKTAMTDEQFGQSEGDILSSARGYVSEESTSRDNFLNAMANIQGQMPSNSFLWKELLMLQPDVDHITNVVMMGPTERQAVHQQGMTADWASSEIETVIATTLSNAVPALMMEYAMTKIALQTTNRNMGAAITTFIANVESFSNIDMGPAVDMFVQKLEATVLQDISMNGDIDFAIQMKVDLLGETWINLSFAGKPPVDFVTPSFCDALLVPVITNDRGHSVNVAKDFEQLTGVVSLTGGPDLSGGHFRPSF